MHNEILESIFQYIKPKIGENSFRDWFTQAFITYENGYKLNFPNKFIFEWVKNNYSFFLFEAAEKIGIKIELVIAQEKNEESSLVESSNINQNFSFENFIIGNSNQMAYEASFRVAESDEIIFNPLFLHGNVGLGKTHLMNAIANYKKKKYPKKKILYLSAEQFLNNFIKALQTKTQMSFKDEFRSADILLIDDFQFVGSKNATQEEFFHTFNSLFENKKQLIISADQPPHALPGVEARLKSRLGWGLVVDIHPASYELKVSILKNKAEKLNLNISDEILGLIAKKINSSIRELEGAFLKVTKYSEWMKQDITKELVNSILHNISNNKPKTNQEVLSAICENLNIEHSELISAARNRTIVRARQKTVYLLRTITGESYVQIAKILGGKDHSSIIYAETQAKLLIKNDPEFAQDIEKIKSLFEN